MIRMNVFIQVEAHNRAELLSVTKELVAASLPEAGCIAYDIFESATRPDVLMFCETWSDEDTLTAHAQSEHFVTLLPKLEQLGKVKIEKFTF